MARLPYLDAADLPAEYEDAVAQPISLYRALAHSPEGSRHFRALGRYIRYDSRLDPRLRELAILQVGYLARAPYEWSHHVKIGFEFGVSDADIRAISEETAGRATALDPLARLVLRAAREMVVEGAMAAASVAELSRALDAETLVDLVITIAFYCGVVRLLGSLAIDVEEAYRPYLEAYPLPAD